MLFQSNQATGCANSTLIYRGSEKDIHMEVDDLCNMMLYDVSNIVIFARRLQ
ncbi:MAG: hypothetical protein M3O97_03635 [Thermoproteota archaeon]|nr:hypothetical protein [Thermoproteota archaeon]